MDQDKKTKLINGAIELFARDGISGTSTGAVAKAAGVAAGTLFNYFPTKEDLIRSAYIDCKIAMAAAARAGLEPDADFRTVLSHVWRACIEWSLANPNHYALMAQMKGTPRTRDEELEKELAGEWMFFHQALEAARERGDIYEIDPGYLMEFFSALFEATIRHAGTLKKKERPDFINSSFEFMWRALSAK